VNSVLRTTFGCEMEEEFIMRNKTNKWIYRDIYIYLLYYKRCSLLHALATVGGHNMEEATLFVVQSVYISLFVLVGFIWLNGQCMVMNYLQMEEEVLDETELCLRLKVR
jgi:hypothetical protein